MKKWYVARWESGSICLYLDEPYLDELGRFTPKDDDWSAEYFLPRDMFPEVTFENSPKEVEIVLKK